MRDSEHGINSPLSATYRVGYQKTPLSFPRKRGKPLSTMRDWEITILVVLCILFVSFLFWLTWKMTWRQRTPPPTFIMVTLAHT
jgi:hypothetical protein